MNKNKINGLVIAAILGAISYLLMYFAFPIIPSVPYLTLDFSNVVILIVFKFWQRKEGYLTLFIKELLHFIFNGPSFIQLLGCLSDALAMIVFVEILIVSKRRLHFTYALILATVGMTIVMAIFNYNILLPIYIKTLAMKLEIPLSKIILWGVIPFNLIKGISIGIVFKVLSNKLAKINKR